MDGALYKTLTPQQPVAQPAQQPMALNPAQWQQLLQQLQMMKLREAIQSGGRPQQPQIQPVPAYTMGVRG